MFTAAAISILNASSSRAEQEWDTFKKEPLAKVRALADKGNPAAQASLANRLLRGIGTRSDVAAGLAWYQKAASKKFPPAMTALGALYEEGAVLPEDKQRAVKLYEEAAALDYPRAQYKLGFLYLWDRKDGGLQDFDKGLQLCQCAAKAGYSIAAVRLGDLYHGGSTHLKKDEKEAVRWYKIAWESGSDYAGGALANAYFNGKGTAKDRRLAVVCFSRYKLAPEAKYWYKRLSAKQVISEPELRQAVQWMCSANQNEEQDKVESWNALHAR